MSAGHGGGAVPGLSRQWDHPPECRSQVASTQKRLFCLPVLYLTPLQEADMYWSICCGPLPPVQLQYVVSAKLNPKSYSVMLTKLTYKLKVLSVSGNRWCSFIRRFLFCTETMVPGNWRKVKSADNWRTADSVLVWRETADFDADSEESSLIVLMLSFSVKFNSHLVISK